MATARTAVEYSVVITIVLAIQALTFTTQERISVNSGRGYDGTHYHAFAEQFAAGARPTGESRLCAASARHFWRRR